MPGSQQQLDVIGEVAQVAGQAGVDLWLRGGWAVDFAVGRVTRAHEDIDLFIWAADADRLVGLLSERGYAESGGPAAERQRNLRRAEVELHVTLLERTAVGGLRTAGAPAQWPDWPPGMLDGPPGRLGRLVVPVVSPEAQLTIKQRFREVWPARPLRDKDRLDVALLEETLRPGTVGG